MPSYGRPKRTERAIKCILDQDYVGWEALVIGDACPVIQQIIDSGKAAKWQGQAADKGNSLIIENRDVRCGSAGYQITNDNINRASGKYLVFFANDDIILQDHLTNYMEIATTNLDYMYFDSYIHPGNFTRVAALTPSSVGHSEIVLKTELARKCRPHVPNYGHDWIFIQEMITKGKGAKSKKGKATYHVMHVPLYGTKDKID